MTFVKWGMAAALALAISPAYADDYKTEAQKEMTQAQQEAQEQKAEARKDAAETKTEAQKEMAEADREAREKSAEAEREAREKTAEAQKDMREEQREKQKEMREEGREVRASDDRTAATAGDPDKAPLSKTAKETLQKLHASSQMEVGMARIAKDKAENDKVKDLAEKIEDDHSEFAEKASEIARERNVELSAHDSMSKNRKHVEQMEKMQGASFDRHFAKMMADEHKKEIKELREAQTKLRANKSDEKVAELVDDALPKLEEHHRMALEAQTAIGGEQRQGRRAPVDARTTPSSTDAQGDRVPNSATIGNQTNPDDLVDKDARRDSTATDTKDENKSR